MTKIKLSPEKYAKLLDMVVTNRHLTENSARISALIERFHTASAHHPSSMFADFSENEVIEIGDFLTHLLAQKGFGADYEPNQFGLELERYIDSFS